MQTTDTAAHSDNRLQPSSVMDFDDRVDAFCFKLAIAIRGILGIDTFGMEDEEEDADN